MQAISATKPVTALPIAHAFHELQQAQAGPSEWYMYFYLKGLAETRKARQIRTSVTALRNGPEGVQAIKLATNTIKHAIENLERAGLIEVVKVPQGVAVFLDITFL